MKEKLTDHDLFKEKIFGLMDGKEIPLECNDIKWGILKIKLEKGEDLERLESKEDNLKFMQVLGHLFSLTDIYLREDMELATKMISIKELEMFIPIVNPYIPDDPDFIGDVLHKDEDIFALIKSEGPIVLRNLTVQNRLLNWLSMENIVSVKLNKLKDALMEYSLGASFKDKLLKQGAPKTDLIGKYGSGWIKEMYDDFRLILRAVKKYHIKKYRDKKYRKKYKSTEISEIIDVAFKESISSRLSKLEKDKQSEESQKKLNALREYMEIYNGSKEMPQDQYCTYPLFEYINNNKKLSTEFQSFTWAPNEFAKEIVAELLGVSDETIRKILYGKSAKQ
ncbi:hypothetical protein ACFLT2_03550 [Acidobacteriota bacterium]